MYPQSFMKESGCAMLPAVQFLLFILAGRVVPGDNTEHEWKREGFPNPKLLNTSTPPERPLFRDNKCALLYNNHNFETSSCMNLMACRSLRFLFQKSITTFYLEYG